jgi:PEP-CTERM motif
MRIPVKKIALIGLAVLSMVCFQVNTGNAYITLNQSVTSAGQSNVIFSPMAGGLVAVSFAGVFDFSPIGGNLEPYSGNFIYDTAKPPVSTSGPDIAHYHFDPQPDSFTIFGSTFTPLSPVFAGGVSLLVQNGTGIVGDFLTLQVSITATNESGIPIPGATGGVWAMGLNAGAFPPDMLTSADFPTDLDVFATSTPHPPNQFAAVNLPIPEPGTLLLLVFGLGAWAALYATNCARAKTRQLS